MASMFVVFWIVTLVLVFSEGAKPNLDSDPYHVSNDERRREIMLTMLLGGTNLVRLEHYLEINCLYAGDGMFHAPNAGTL
jgi:hypothetical protein